MTDVMGVVLAGGLATRMGGGDKSLLSLSDQPILSHVLDRLTPQVSSVVLNANGPPERFATFGVPVIADQLTGHLGPLAGVHAAMIEAKSQGVAWIASVAGDSPFFPDDFVNRCYQAASDVSAPVVLASSYDPEHDRWMRHPTFGLWSVDLCDALGDALLQGVRKIVMWTDSVGGITVEFPTPEGELDPFFNVNTPEDLQVANQRAVK
jgi:molybdopterin-guanine dinucleotide biosynthesis protein A, proteobacterial